MLNEDESESSVKKVKQLQVDWKDIGPVPRKKSNEVYERFKKACDAFFQRRRGELADQQAGFEENFKQFEADVSDAVKAAAIRSKG